MGWGKTLGYIAGGIALGSYLAPETFGKITGGWFGDDPTTGDIERNMFGYNLGNKTLDATGKSSGGFGDLLTSPIGLSAVLGGVSSFMASKDKKEQGEKQEQLDAKTLALKEKELDRQYELEKEKLEILRSQGGGGGGASAAANAQKEIASKNRLAEANLLRGRGMTDLLTAREANKKPYNPIAGQLLSNIIGG